MGTFGYLEQSCAATLSAANLHMTVTHQPPHVPHRELAAVGIQREPTEEDFRYLATRAGFVVGPDSVRATSASLGELAAFKQWFAG